jgi:hypothetical protein
MSNGTEVSPCLRQDALETAGPKGGARRVLLLGRFQPQEDVVWANPAAVWELYSTRLPAASNEAIEEGHLMPGHVDSDPAKIFRWRR